MEIFPRYPTNADLSTFPALFLYHHYPNHYPTHSPFPIHYPSPTLVATALRQSSIFADRLLSDRCATARGFFCICAKTQTVTDITRCNAQPLVSPKLICTFSAPKILQMHHSINSIHLSQQPNHNTHLSRSYPQPAALFLYYHYHYPIQIHSHSPIHLMGRYKHLLTFCSTFA